jgi:hypothetical protein
MFAEELAQTQLRAALQAEERNARYEVRSVSNDTHTSASSDINLQNSHPNTRMEDQQYKKIIDSIPTFSGEPRENVNDWLEVVSLKFDIIGYDNLQKRRFVPQYLSGNALKWHLAHREQLESWNEYTTTIKSAFPHHITTSRDMNLKMLRERKQGGNEAFTDYYTSVMDLCHKHDPDMTDLQIIDWMKAGMELKLYEKLQGEDFTTPQALLTRAQRVELDNAVLDARKRESATQSSATPSRPSFNDDRPPRWSSPSHFSPPPTQNCSRPYPPSLLSLPSPTLSYPSFSTPSDARTPFPSQSPAYGYSGSNTADVPTRPRRPVVCYSCGEHGHISPQCPYRPKD